MKKLSAAFGLLVVLAACSTEQAPPPAPVSHNLPPKIALDVRIINLTDRSSQQQVGAANNFQPTISDAIKQWSSDRLQAAGQWGQAIVVIKDASLIQQQLPVKDGIDSWFTRQQGVKYVGHAEVTIEANNGKSASAVTDASAVRSITLPEDPTPLEKQDAYFSLLNGLMKDLGQNLENGIQTHMGNLIVSNTQVYGVTAVPTGSNNAPVSPLVVTSAPAPSQIPASTTSMAFQSGIVPPAFPSATASAPTEHTLQPPSLGTLAVPTVPSLGSTPSSFPVASQDAQPQPMAELAPPAPAYGQAVIPLSGPGM